MRAYATDLASIACSRVRADESLADEDRLTVMLCHRCHTNLHDHGTCDRELQKIAQKTYMEHYHKTGTSIFFINRYGKSISLVLLAVGIYHRMKAVN